MHPCSAPVGAGTHTHTHTHTQRERERERETEREREFTFDFQYIAIYCLLHLGYSCAGSPMTPCRADSDCGLMDRCLTVINYSDICNLYNSL